MACERVHLQLVEGRQHLAADLTLHATFVQLGGPGERALELAVGGLVLREVAQIHDRLAELALFGTSTASTRMLLEHARLVVQVTKLSTHESVSMRADMH